VTKAQLNFLETLELLRKTIFQMKEQRRIIDELKRDNELSFLYNSWKNKFTK
jgi:hypothetical protein